MVDLLRSSRSPVAGARSGDASDPVDDGARQCRRGRSHPVCVASWMCGLHEASHIVVVVVVVAAAAALLSTSAAGAGASAGFGDAVATAAAGAAVVLVATGVAAVTVHPPPPSPPPPAQPSPPAPPSVAKKESYTSRTASSSPLYVPVAGSNSTCTLRRTFVGLDTRGGASATADLPYLNGKW